MAESGKLARIELSGYKSIKDLSLDLESLNIMIGPNGAGKSNFISFFYFLNKILERDLQLYVSQKGTAEAFLYFGSKETSRIKARLFFPPNGYQMELVPTGDGKLVFKRESIEVFPPNSRPGIARHYEGEQRKTRAGEEESLLKKIKSPAAITIKRYLNSLKIYHFHDTSDTASVKKSGSINDNLSLRPQGENLAAFLYSIQDTPEYERIVQTIQRVAPFFHDFILVPEKNNKEQIRLRWKHKGSDAYFDANGLSDGTLRFICLTALLLQPELPRVILLDEPELGLHPYALQILAGMLKSASNGAQIIVSTQSVTFANQFGWQDIIIVDQKDGESLFNRIKEEEIKPWLEDYAIGDLWEKNLIGGTPD